jgi:hypothetical protein
MLKSRRMRWVWHVTWLKEKRSAYRTLVGKREGKRPLRRPRCRWVNNIKTHLKETGWSGVDWIRRGHDRDWWRVLVNMMMNLWVA